MKKPKNSSGTLPDSTSHKKNQVDTQAVVELLVESVRQKRKKQTAGVKRTRSGIASKLCKEVGITRPMALFMLKDIHQYKIRDIEPKYMNYGERAKKRRPKEKKTKPEEA